MVSYLSTHFSVEWCLFKDKESLTRIYSIMTGIISNDNAQTTFCSFIFIQELRWFSDISEGFILHTHRTTFNDASTRTVLLFFHGSFETFMVNLEAFVFSQFFCQFHWESVSIVKFEDVFTFKRIFTRFLKVSKKFIKHARTCINSTCKGFFFTFNDFFDKVFLLKNFWVIAFHDFTNCWNKFVQESIRNTETTAVHYGTTEKTTKDITTTFITWKSAITDGKGQ